MSGILERPGSRGGVLRAWLSGLALLLLSSYMLLLAGWFDTTSGRVVGRILSTDSVRVTIPSLHTDLFWSSRVDTVLVEGRGGLVVRVTGGRTRGAIHSFFLSRTVSGVSAAGLEIIIPAPRAGGAHATLARVLEDIDRGIVCSADSLELDYGFIEDDSGVLLDSMRLRASVARNGGIAVSAANASCWIRGVGTVSGNGQVFMEDGVVSSPGFSGSTPWGNLYFSGRLEGVDGSVFIAASGTFDSESLRLPVTASMDFDAEVTGTIARPVFTADLRNGRARSGDLSLDFSADTALVSLQGIALRGLRISGPGASATLDGRLTLPDFGWEGSCALSMSGADPSVYDRRLPAGRLDGSAFVSMAGDMTGPHGGSVSLDLRNSTAGAVAVTSASVDGSFSGDAWDASADLNSSGAHVAFSGGGRLGAHFAPSSYRGRLQLELADESVLPLATRPGSLSFSDLRADLLVEGSSGRSSFSGSASIARLAAAGAVVTGGSATGSLQLSRSGPEGSFSFGVDGLEAGGMSLGAHGDASVSGSRWDFGDIAVAGPGGVELDASGSIMLGDTTLVSFSDLRAAKSKLRLVTGGEIAGRMTQGAFLLDTLSLQTPHGHVGLSGSLGPADSAAVRMTLDEVDFASLASALSVPGGVSGVGDFGISASAGASGLDAEVSGAIRNPSCGTYSADSITVDLSIADSDLRIAGIYSWKDGSRSGIAGSVDDIWSNGGPRLGLENPADLEMEVNRWGDWVFYALPIPIRTRGADISAHASYTRTGDGRSRFDAEAVAMAEKLTVTSLGMPFTDVVLYFTHHSADTSGYNTSVKIASVGRSAYGLLSADLLINIDSLLVAPSLGAYRFNAGFDAVRSSIGGFAAVNLSGSIFASGADPLTTRPELTGKIVINEALVGTPGGGGSAAGGPSRLPFDLNISVRSNRGVWFRNSLADIELGVDITILTVDSYPTLGGTLTSLRGRVRLLDRDFEIESGSVEFISSVPPETRMSITASTVVRNTMDRSEYTIEVTIQGTPSSPVITLSGEGPSGTLTQEDILALLAVGLTYGQLQQIDTGDIRSQLEDAAQGYLGRLLARSLREGIGLDELQLTPELLADSTSLTLDIGKYVLPDLFVSYSGDVFSTEPGTISAQYYFSRDMYMTGSTKSTLHGSQEPSLELHYTFRY